MADEREFSDREIHTTLAAQAIACPTCNALLDFQVTASASAEDRDALCRLMRNKQLAPVTIEEAIEETKRHQADGGELHNFRGPQ